MFPGAWGMVLGGLFTISHTLIKAPSPPSHPHRIGDSPTSPGVADVGGSQPSLAWPLLTHCQLLPPAHININIQAGSCRKGLPAFRQTARPGPLCFWSSSYSWALASTLSPPSSLQIPEKPSHPCQSSRSPTTTVLASPTLTPTPGLKSDIKHRLAVWHGSNYPLWAQVPSVIK